MRILLDTHLLIWASEARSRVPAAAQALMDQPGVTNIFSVASIWETAIKFALNRADFRVDPQLFRRGLLDNGYEELDITASHALAAGSLPPLHRDPFDRILVAQAGVEGYLLLSSDPLVTQYPGPVRAV